MAEKKERRYMLSLSNDEDKQALDIFIEVCKKKGIRWSTEIARLVKEDIEIRQMRGEE